MAAISPDGTHDDNAHGALPAHPLGSVRSEEGIADMVVGNADAHAKNFSVLHDTDNPGIRLAPLYDVLSTVDAVCTMLLHGVPVTPRYPSLIGMGIVAGEREATVRSLRWSWVCGREDGSLIPS